WAVQMALMVTGNPSPSLLTSEQGVADRESGLGACTCAAVRMPAWKLAFWRVVMGRLLDSPTRPVTDTVSVPPGVRGVVTSRSMWLPSASRVARFGGPAMLAMV